MKKTYKFKTEYEALQFKKSMQFELKASKIFGYAQYTNENEQHIVTVRYISEK